MEILIILLGAGILYFGYRLLDKPKADGSHPLDAATKAPYKIEPATTTKIDGIGHESVPVQPTISNILDVNKDGKVDVADVKVVATKAKANVKKVATKAKTTVAKAKTATKRPKTKPASQA